MVDGVVYKVAYRLEDNRLVVHLLGRTTDQTRLDCGITGTRPYFYVPRAEADSARPLSDVTGVEDGPSCVTGQTMSRVFVRYPFHVRNIKTRFSFYAEADIIYSIRQRVDHQLNAIRVSRPTGTFALPQVTPLRTPPRVEPRVLDLDIEVAAPKEGGFADVEQANHPINAVGFYDNYRNSYACLFTGPTAPPEAEVLSHLSRALGAPIRLMRRPNERALLATFGDLLGQIDPDVVAAWNGESYDFPYLAKRATKLAASEPDEEMRKDLMVVARSFANGDRRTWGRFAPIDLMRVYQKQYVQQKAHGLEAVAQEHLGFGKVSRDVGVSELHDTNLSRFIAYNVWDVHLMRLIDAKLGLTGYATAISQICAVELEDVYFNSRLIDGMLLQEARAAPDGRPSVCLPAKDFAPQGIHRGKGAAVFEPALGVHVGVIELDLKAEYPSIIETFNISPETVSPRPVPGGYVLPGKRYYRGGSDGLMPRSLQRMRAYRVFCQDERGRLAADDPMRSVWNERQRAVKYVMNSFAGVMDEPHWRLANVDMFNDITGIAREHLRWNREHLESKEFIERVLGPGYHTLVIGGDTDSCFVEITHLGAPMPLEESLPAAKRLQAALNATYAEFAGQYGAKTHVFEVSLKAIYSRVRLFPKRSGLAAKKRYIGLKEWDEEFGDVRAFPVSDEKRRLKISGIEIRRFNVGPMQKEAQMRTVVLQLDGRAPEISPYRLQMRAEVLAGQRDDLLWVPCKVGRDLDTDEAAGGYEANQPFIRAMRNSQEVLGMSAHKGDAMKWVPVVPGSVEYRSQRFDHVREMAIPYLDTYAEWETRGLKLNIDRSEAWRRVEDAMSIVYPELHGRTTGLMEE
jgi:DNA polymerase elongation subunit (family B)